MGSLKQKFCAKTTAPPLEATCIIENKHSVLECASAKNIYLYIQSVIYNSPNNKELKFISKNNNLVLNYNHKSKEEL